MESSILLSFFLLYREHKYGIRNFLSQLLLLIFIFAIVITLFLMPENYKFMRVMPIQTAQYDLKMSGPLMENDYKEIRKFNEVQSILGVTEFVTDVSHPKKNCATIANIAFTTDMGLASSLLPTNNKMLKAGSFKKGCAVISIKAADLLKVQVGDIIQVQWKSFDISGYTMRYKISGILYETSSSKPQIIIDNSRDSNILNKIEQKIATSSKPAKYTAFYLKTKKNINQNKLQTRIDSYLNNRTTFEWREDVLMLEKEEVENLDNKQLKYIKYGSLILYISLIVLFISLRRKQREKSYAILYAIGATQKEIYIHFFIDVFILTIVILISSVYLSILYSQYCLSFYYSTFLIKKLFLYALIFNLLSALLASALASIKISKLNLAEVLARE